MSGSPRNAEPLLNRGALAWRGQLAPVGEPLGTIHPWLGENGLNNASYRAATVGGLPSLTLALTGPTFREMSALYAWQAADPGVEIVNADRQTFFPGDPLDPPLSGFYADHWVVERFEAARRVTEVAEGVLPYHYEYTIHNMNSDTSADGFVVDFPGSASFANVGFHDIDHHSGEPFDTADWTIDADGPNGKITWTAVDMGDNTNALRWGTSFSFWFDSNMPPTTMAHALDLFKINEMQDVPFPTLDALIFEDGFESGSTDQWDQTIP